MSDIHSNNDDRQIHGEICNKEAPKDSFSELAVAEAVRAGMERNRALVLFGTPNIKAKYGG